MNIRKITSLVSLLSFLLMLLTSIILYFVPPGRIAYWADWHFWGLTKEQWGNLHINLGFLFLLASALHIYYNWSAITTYLKDKAKQLRIFTPNFNAALVITLVFGFGTFFQVPPFSYIQKLDEYFETNASRKYGEPPYGHAELSSLKKFVKNRGLDLEESVALLKKANITFDSTDQILKDIAKLNGISPQQIYMTIKPVQEKDQQGAKKPLPEAPPMGFGKRPLDDICAEFGLDVDKLIKGLAAKGFKATPEGSIKKIAEEHGANPLELYEIVREIAGSSKS